jgi:hypothetical protein
MVSKTFSLIYSPYKDESIRKKISKKSTRAIFLTRNIAKKVAQGNISAIYKPKLIEGKYTKL